MNSHKYDRRTLRYNSNTIRDTLQNLTLIVTKKIDAETCVATLSHTVDVGTRMLDNGSVTAVVVGIDDFKQYNDSFNNLLRVLAEKDMYTFVHSQYTSKYAVTLGEELGLSNYLIRNIYFAGWLHDIGKIVVTSEILRKPSRLDNYEYDIIKTHVVNGLNIITPYNFDDIVKNAIRFHHERWDGKGYPNGILGKDTPIEGRIMQVADAFSAMTIKRIYREQMSMKDAMEEINRNRGTQFDPDIAKTFIELIKRNKLAM